MGTYDSLYETLLKAAYENRLDEAVEKQRQDGTADEKDLDILLHPGRQPLVTGLADACTCALDHPGRCQLSCLFSAIERDPDGKIRIHPANCTGCSECIRGCEQGALKERKDIIPLFEKLHARDMPVYTMIAPAFLGQFGPDITSGKLRSAFKKLGFYGMVEVALFADILTLKEALEFDRQVKTEKDFLLTSCCCPLWVAVIRKMYSSFTAHIPPSVSPMVACGRSIKRIHPGAVTVFVGPCLAKKAEAREPDVADAVDYVLTFQEMQDVFRIAEIDPVALEDDHKDHSSRSGRIYARTGGVSEAVESTLKKLVRDRRIPLVAQQANGMIQCKQLLEQVAAGDITANFLEGMGCIGGCVGGPRVMIDPAEGERNVDEYGGHAVYETPVDNPYTFALLKRLGFETVEALLERDHMFTRDFTADGGKKHEK